MNEKYIKIGHIINTHGIKGELKINPLTDDVKRFNDLEIVFLGEDKEKHLIKNVKYIKNFPIIKLEKFDNINDVLKYKNSYLYIDKEDLVELEKDQYFIFDIIGCKVFNTEDEYIGIVKDVITYSSNDVYVIKNSDKNQDYLIPALKQFIKTIDIENKTMIIKPIEGMIE